MRVCELMFITRRIKTLVPNPHRGAYYSKIIAPIDMKSYVDAYNYPNNWRYRNLTSHDNYFNGISKTNMLNE